MPQFDVSTFYSQIFWLIVIFGSLYFTVLRFISPATEQIFKNRKTVVDGAVKDAELLTLQTETLKKDYDAHFKEIINQAEEIKKQSLNKLNVSFAEKNVKLLAEIDSKRQELLNEIELNLKYFLTDQQQPCISLANFIIEKITNKKLDVALLNKCYERIK